MEYGQAKPFTHGKRTGGPKKAQGYKQPRYSGGNRARASSTASSTKQKKTGIGGNTVAGKTGIPGAGQMKSGSAAGHLSYPTSNSGVRTVARIKHTTKSSDFRRSKRETRPGMKPHDSTSTY